MVGRDRSGPDDPEREAPEPGSFAAALEEMGDVEPLDRPGPGADREAPRQPGRRRIPGSDDPRSAPASATPGKPSPLGGARRRGLGARDLRRLRAGKLRPEERIDLHRLTRAEARERLASALARLSQAGTRCVLVIHGKGLGSEGGRAVLKTALQSWLGEPPFDALVLDSAPARPRDGGEGATYLVLR